MTEKELCNQYINCLQKKYPDVIIVPEFDGWDIYYMIGNIRFGVQAKLKFNTKVISQCLSWENVHYKIILLPNLETTLDSDLLRISWRLKIIVVSLDFPSEYNPFKYRHKPILFPQVKNLVGIPAGIPAPRTVTEEKLALCKLEKLYNEKGYLETKDFYDFGFEKGQIQYYRYDAETYKWFARDRKASLDYPHIFYNLDNKS